MASVEELKGFKIFKGLNDRELELVANIAQEETHDAGVRMFEEKAKATHLYLVLDGKVEIKVKTADEDRVTVAEVTPGEILGWSVIVEPFVRTAGAWVVEKTKVLSLSAESLRDLFEKNNHIGYRVTKEIAAIISGRLKALDAKYAEKLQAK